jgi:Na+/proline symporter/nitrogen-specific signal transduction histidine kinase
MTAQGPAIAPLTVVGASVLYLGTLYAVAWWADRRAALERSVIDDPWIYALSMGVYCTAWTYFGSIGRAANGGLWFLPIYLGPTLGMVLAAVLLPRMIELSRRHRITSIADLIAHRHGKSRLVAALVTVIAVLGLLPYVALQLKAVSVGYEVLTAGSGAASSIDTPLVVSLLLAGFSIAFGTRHLDASERHEGLVAAVAVESVVKLVAFVAVGAFVVWGLFSGPGDLVSRAAASMEAQPGLQAWTDLSAGAPRGADGGPASPGTAWLALTVLAMLASFMLPRQFQVMVVEATRAEHVRRAVWVFPLYLLAINVFVLPIAMAGVVLGEPMRAAETFVLSLPLAAGQSALALVAFIGGLSAATGMVIVETVALSTMVCNDLVVPLLLRRRMAPSQDMARVLLGVRRATIVAILLLGYLYYRLAGEADALVSIGLISFAAVAQFAPAFLGAVLWRGGTRNGALAALAVGALLWSYTLLLPSLARSGWLDDAFLHEGLFGLAWLRPEQLFGTTGLDKLTHSLLWSLGLNTLAYVGVSLWRAPGAAEAAQAHLWLEASPADSSEAEPVFWQGRARLSQLRALLQRFLGAERGARLLDEHLRGRPVTHALGPGLAEPQTVQWVETQLAGVLGSASARVVMARSVDEEALGLDDVMRILQDTSREAQQLREHAELLEAQRRSLEATSAQLQRANAQLQSLDRLKDDFMSSVTHELRTPLTAIRAVAELLHDDPEMEAAQRQQFLDVIVSEAERLSRLVNQVLDLAKIESGHAQWQTSAVDLPALVQQSAKAVHELLREREVELVLSVGPVKRPLMADADRLMQVLINLLSNAIKFVPAKVGRIELALRETNEGVCFTVTDNGPGIEPGQQAAIFEKFHQAEGLARAKGGTGLGLPICRQIVEHFGGRIWVRSDPEQAAPGATTQDGGSSGVGPGAVFGVDLPWRNENAANDDSGASTPQETSDERSLAQAGARRG